MKLSLKFFCIAYIIVLLAAGIPSAVFIQNSVDTAWSSREKMVTAGENYAVSSFMSLAELTSGKLSQNRIRNIIAQIRNTLDSNIAEFGIVDGDSVKEYSSLNADRGLQFYFEKDGELIMESVCKVESGGYEYCIFVRSYFTELKNEHLKLWRYYSIAVFSVAVVGGVLLYIIVKKVTKPLKLLTSASNKMAGGSYGNTVSIKTSDLEIQELAKSFNTMSVATENSLNEIRNEVAKRERFVANFTHEMKTPMTAIVGYAQLLNSYELSQSEERQAAEAIFKEGKRLEALSLQLLELFVTQNERPEFSVISLSDIEKRLCETMRFSAEKYGCAFSVSFPAVRIKASEPLMLSLLYNLCDNAFKASNKGDKVTVSGEVFGRKVKISVADTGRGIAPESIKHLTEPFYREDKARSRKQGGAGIGLSLCKEIAVLHGSVLLFESEQGKGTTVSFEIMTEAEYE